jgi:hypothetical protein
VALGVTGAEPERAKEVWSSVRIEGEIATESAFVLFHVSVADWPEPITAGDAAKVIAGAEPDATTFTTAVEEVDRPLESVAVAVYVVVVVGDTVAEPVMGKVPEPTAGEIVKEAALVTFHDNVAD